VATLISLTRHNGKTEDDKTYDNTTTKLTFFNNIKISDDDKHDQYINRIFKLQNANYGYESFSKQ